MIVFQTCKTRFYLNNKKNVHKRLLELCNMPTVFNHALDKTKAGAETIFFKT